MASQILRRNVIIERWIAEEVDPMVMVWFSTRTRSEEDVGMRTTFTNPHENDIRGVGARKHMIDMKWTAYRIVLAMTGDEAEVVTTIATAVVTATGDVGDKL